MSAQARDDAPTASSPSISVRERLASLEQVVTGQQEEISAQRSQLAALGAEIARLYATLSEQRPGPAPAQPLARPSRRAAGEAAGEPDRANGPRASRRALLRLGGAAAAAGVAAGAIELWKPAGARAAGARADTVTLYESASGNIDIAIEGEGFSGAWGIFGTSSGGIGVEGATDNSTGVRGVATSGGDGVVGVSFGGGHAVTAASDTGIDLSAIGTGRIQQVSQGVAWPPTSGSWLRGEQIRDANQDLWICVAGGSPGTWRRVAAPQVGYAGGALNLLPVPIRLLDTRDGAPVGYSLPGHPIPYHGTLQMQAANIVNFQGQTIPARASAVFGNLVVALAPGVNPGAGSSLKAYANGTTPPAGVVNLVYNPGDLSGEYTGTFTLVAIGAGYFVNLYSQPINAGVAVDVIFDAFGFVM